VFTSLEQVAYYLNNQEENREQLMFQEEQPVKDCCLIG
jgi:hypothetical protein